MTARPVVPEHHTTSYASLTAGDNYFEDFAVGDLYQHARGKTITEMDNVLITNLVMNTAQGHFNEVLMSASEFGQRITFGGITASIILGLASQDTGENALRELGVDGLRLMSPVFHGDTLWAFTEVLGTENEDANSGVVEFKHWGINQRDQVVFEGRRRTLVRRRAWWADA